MFLMKELYDMGNEPNMGYPYLFNFVRGEEWRTQKHVRNIINTYFGAGPDGLPGNDDTGTMSAWLMYGMMGFYPIIARKSCLHAQLAHFRQGDHSS
jgi:putative alpha-1,2-mannosidase